MGFQNTVKPKRSLGQNFFVNENLGNKIVENVLQSKPSRILEIGPGRGFFTEKFLKENILVTAIEKDDMLAQELTLRFPTLKVLHKDVLDIDFSTLNLTEDTVIYGSLPYNISKPIINNILKEVNPGIQMYFIIQKEVADKYVDKEPNNNILSVLTHTYASTKKLFDINPGSFRPKPKVTSSLISFTKGSCSIENIDKYRKFLESSFTSPRKKLRNNLGSFKDIIQKEYPNLLDLRPQELTVEQYIQIYNLIQSQI